MQRQRIPTELQDAVKIFCKKKKEHRYTLQYIGNIIGKDHSTVMHHIAAYNNLYETDRFFREKADAFSEEQFLADFHEYRTALADKLVNQIH